MLEVISCCSMHIEYAAYFAKIFYSLKKLGSKDHEDAKTEKVSASESAHTQFNGWRPTRVIMVVGWGIAD